MLRNFRIPPWIWGAALAVNAALFAYNFEEGNEDLVFFNLLCATACIVGLIINRSK